MTRTIVFGIIIILLVMGCESSNKEEVLTKNSKEEVPEDTVDVVQKDAFGLPIDSLEVSDHKVRPNESLYVILDELGFSPREIYSFTQQASDVFDVSKLKPGQRYRTYASADSGSGISRMVLQPNRLEYIVFDWQQDSLKAYRAARPLTQKKAVASGTVSNSLYQTISEQGDSPMLAYKMADIFAWQINFFGLREGDSFNVLYNKQYIGDDFWSIGDVLAAKFVHRGETYRAYKFSKGDIDGYFTKDGQSVEKALLKAPFKFSQRISSPFSRNRYHPILKKRRPHYGIDYAAPRGTPVLSVGDGIVTKAGYGRGSGNIVKIKHNGTYQTAYMHLSDFASGIRRGARVEQGQVIAYVGSTGMSTGPHLHYTLYKNKRPVNALAIDLPSSESVPDSLMDDFRQVRDSLDKQLEDPVEDKQSQTDEMITALSDY